MQHLVNSVKKAHYSSLSCVKVALHRNVQIHSLLSLDKKKGACFFLSAEDRERREIFGWSCVNLFFSLLKPLLWLSLCTSFSVQDLSIAAPLTRMKHSAVPSMPLAEACLHVLVSFALDFLLLL